MGEEVGREFIYPTIHHRLIPSSQSVIFIFYRQHSLTQSFVAFHISTPFHSVFSLFSTHITSI